MWKPRPTRGSRTFPSGRPTRDTGIGSWRCVRWWRPWGCWRSGWPSAVPDHQHIAILDDVLFAFQLEQSLFAHAGVAAQIHQRFPVHHFGADELLLEIGMDRARGPHRGGVHGDGPRPAFVLAGGQE